jgi:hypothetical protein
VSNIILYGPTSNRIIILEHNIGEYWANWKIVTEDYNPPVHYFKGQYYDGELESWFDAGWVFIGDYT